MTGRGHKLDNKRNENSRNVAESEELVGLIYRRQRQDPKNMGVKRMRERAQKQMIFREKKALN